MSLQPAKTGMVALPCLFEADSLVRLADEWCNDKSPPLNDQSEKTRLAEVHFSLTLPPIVKNTNDLPVFHVPGLAGTASMISPDDPRTPTMTAAKLAVYATSLCRVIRQREGSARVAGTAAAG